VLQTTEGRDRNQSAWWRCQTAMSVTCWSRRPAWRGRGGEAAACVELRVCPDHCQSDADPAEMRVSMMDRRFDIRPQCLTSLAW